MKELLTKAQSVYISVLRAHIRTKTLDPVFHASSEAFYESLFDVFHTIGEKMEDTGTPIYPQKDCMAIIQGVYDNIEALKLAVEEQIKQQNSVGTDNLLRGIADNLESVCGNAKAFITEEKEEK